MADLLDTAGRKNYYSKSFGDDSEREITMPAIHRDVELHLNILRDLHYEIPLHSPVLDFGCGAGDLVAAYRAAGYDAVGADVHLDAQGPALHAITAATFSLM